MKRQVKKKKKKKVSQLILTSNSLFYPLVKPDNKSGENRVASLMRWRLGCYNLLSKRINGYFGLSAVMGYRPSGRDFHSSLQCAITFICLRVMLILLVSAWRSVHQRCFLVDWSFSLSIGIPCRGMSGNA